MTDLKQKALSLPYQPGVYIMLDRMGEVIYVGKAKQLKNRVSQYFHDSAGHSAKTAAMVSLIHDFDVIVADSEFEALVLECSLIKRHQPKYNILLKDDKGYPFIRLSNEAYPRFSISSRAENDGARYFGPYGGRSTTREVINAIQAALRLPTCQRRFPRDIGRGRPCLNFHLNNCIGFCRGTVDEQAYRELIGQAVMLLEGKHEAVANGLRSQMEAAAQRLDFENAALLRDRYNAIMRLAEKQKVISGSRMDMDVIGYYAAAKGCIAVLHYDSGKLFSRDIEFVESALEDSPEEVLSAFIKQYYLVGRALPRRILLPCLPEDIEPVSRLLSQQAGRRVELFVPRRGQNVSLVRLAEKNAGQEAERVTTREERVAKSLSELQKALKITALPARIEAFDVSNTSGGEIVASMTVFVHAAPKKSEYRYFKMKEKETQDDYHAMREAVSRRMKRYLGGDDRFACLPDVLFIDGGYAHAATVKGVLDELGIALPVYGMVKDDRHRTRALVTPNGEEIGISGSTALFSLVGRIQEETHRFAIGYHRALRAKRGYGSELDAVAGVGKTRKMALLKHFKSLAAIKRASLEELHAAVPANAAQAVYSHFHPTDGQAPGGSPQKKE